MRKGEEPRARSLGLLATLVPRRHVTTACLNPDRGGVL